jgi:hypothetical protein
MGQFQLVLRPPFQTPAIIAEISFPSFYQDHTAKKPRVSVYRASSGPLGCLFNLLCYSIPGIVVDYDGAPNAYAPPISAKDSRPKDGRKAIDHLRNGTTDAKAVFNEEGNNTFEWSGVVARPKSKTGINPNLDAREFLRDHNGHYPVIEGSGDYKGFYKPHSKLGKNGLQINALSTAYGVVSGSLKRAGVRMGDVGLVIDMKTGTATGFMYCDAAGDSESRHPNDPKKRGKYSRGVSEFSFKVKSELGSGDQPVAVFVFPGSTYNSNALDPEMTMSLLRACLHRAPGSFVLQEVVPRVTSNPVYQSSIKAKLNQFGLSGLS